MSDETPGSTTAEAAPAAPTGTSTAGEGTPAKPFKVFATEDDYNAEQARVRRAAEKATQQKIERDTAEKARPAEERIASLEQQIQSLTAEKAMAEHLSRSVTEAARLGFTSSTYLKTALGEAMTANPDAVDYAAVARRAVALAEADGLAPKAVAAGAGEGPDIAGVITPNQTGASAGNSTELAHMSRDEALRRSVSDPEWRKNVWLPHLDKLKADAQKGLKE